MIAGRQELVELSHQQLCNQQRVGQLMNFSNALNAANLVAQFRA